MRLLHASRSVLVSLALAFVLVFVAAPVLGQGPTGTLSGTASDPSGAAIIGAEVKATDNATRAEYSTKTSADGHFVIANLNSGVYTVTVTMQGFKKGVFKEVKIVIGQTYDLTAKLDLGEISSTVVVEAGQEVVETTTAAVGASITGRAITELPFTSRNTLELAILMPGAATTGRARQTSFNGLPRGAINITYDGINAQDNLLKSSDGFFMITRPGIDAVEEFSITTAANGAQDSGQGAVQIKFETKRGGNAFHGGVWEYLRNDYFNSNYYFNNQKGLPRQVQRLNRFGYKIGGPILKDRLFFFTDFDFSSNPQSRSFTRKILSPDAANGVFTYGVTVNAQNVLPTGNAWTTCVSSSPRNNGEAACTVNLPAFAAGNALTFVTDPQITKIIANTQAARGNANIATSTFNPWLDDAAFNQPGTSAQKFPDFRFDWNATKKHQLTAIYHYSHFTSTPDFLNNVNPFLPIEPFKKLFGSQISNRYHYTLAWRWNVGSNKSNELRFGVQSSLVAFRPDQDAGQYQVADTNLGKISVRPVLPSTLFPGGGGVTNFQPILSYGTNGRNTPFGTLVENFSWARGKHSFTFGGEFTEIRFRTFSKTGRLVQTANIGMVSTDPADGSFTAGNYPGTLTTNADGTTSTNSAVLNAAKALFATLTGRLSSYSGTISVDPTKKQYVPLAPIMEQAKQHEFGFYGTDSWRLRPSLTFTYGLRWEYQGSPYDTLDESFSAVNGFSDVFGRSGLNNLFKPGTLPGKIPEFRLNGDRRWYNRDLGNFAPSAGLAWQPNTDIPVVKRIFPGGGKTVFRAGYSISYTREGFSNFNSIAYANPGINGRIFANPVTGACPPGAITSTPPSGQYPAGCVTFNGLLSGQLQTLKTSPDSFPSSGTFPLLAFSGQSVNAFDPNLRTPRVQSWSVGIQRQLGQDTVLEVRYVANHSTGLWRQDNVNEVNIRENGFLNEFNAAAKNLKICETLADQCLSAQESANLDTAIRTTSNFANWGLPGQVNLPILTAAFTGAANGLQTDANFRSSTFVTFLSNGVAGAFANNLAFNTTFMCRLAGQTAFPGACPTSAPLTTSFPANFFVANPHASGGGSSTGAFRFYNGSQSTYNALQIEVRRRLSKGLQFSGNYAFSKSLTNYYGDSSSDFSGFTTLRDQGYDKGPSPWDLRHNFKLQALYELPFGPGHRWSTSNSFMNRIIGGWQINGINRWQSGRVFQLTSGQGGTLNQNDPGVVLSGITRNELQDMLGVRKTTTGRLDAPVFYFPASLIDDGKRTANFLRVAPCSTPGQLCQKVFLTGPRFFRADISLIKKARITERVSFELRGEALNAFNTIDFFFPGDAANSVPTHSVTSTSFGKITDAFRDPNTTDDNGGRIIQLVVRINF